MSRIDECDPKICKKCRTQISIDDGCDPSDYCHCCCQDIVANLMDDTPIDESFAATVRSGRAGLWESNKTQGRWWFQVAEFDAPVTTRGQVRCLLLAAGIECDV